MSKVRKNRDSVKEIPASALSQASWRAKVVAVLVLAGLWLPPLTLWCLVRFAPLDSGYVIGIAVACSSLLTAVGYCGWRWIDRLLRRVARRDALLDKLAVTDAMTSVFNHRGFMEILERDFARSRRYSRPFCAMRLDIDFFRRINDGYGHAVGDEVIIELAATARETVRANVDAVGRLSGAAFGILLPDTGHENAARFAERLRERIAKIEVPTARGDHVHFTVSIGVAEQNAADVSAASLLGRAEQAMLRAKDEGRDRVVLSVEADANESADVNESDDLGSSEDGTPPAAS